MTEKTRISFEELQALAKSAFQAAGVSEPDAELASHIMITADLQGIDTHGIKRLPPYMERLYGGVFNAKPNIQIYAKATSSIVIDGDNGLGQVVGGKALKIAMDTARETGTAFVACRNSQHFGALAPYALKASKEGMVCFLGSNAFPTMAPTGGKEIKLGNNPLGFGAPRRDAPPFILDVAMSVAARGKMRAAEEKGQAIPEGWALDADGNPTTDPTKGLNGYVLPIGDHKGYGLALVVDILAGVLSGGSVATEVNSLFKQTEKPQQVSHFFFVIDPAATIGMDAFLERMEMLCTLMKNTQPFQSDTPVLVPGEIEARTAQQRSQHGIPIDSKFLESVKSLARGEVPTGVSSV